MSGERPEPPRPPRRWWAPQIDCDAIDRDPLRHPQYGPDDLAPTGDPIRHPRSSAPMPGWARGLVVVALLLGFRRVAIAAEAWQQCGMPTGAAWVQSAVNLGARQSSLDCLGVGLGAGR